MEKWNIYLTLDASGHENLLKYLSSYWCCSQFSGSYANLVGNESTNRFAVVCPPCLLTQKSDIQQGFYSWEHENKIPDLALDQYNNLEPSADLSDEDELLIADCLHQLTNELPLSGHYSVQVMLFIGINSLSISYNIISALKRLEVWNKALFLEINDNPDNIDTCWKGYINFKDFTFKELQAFQAIPYLWKGELNLMLHKRCGQFMLNYSMLCLSEDENLENVEQLKEIPFVKIFLKSLDNCSKTEEKYMFDHQIQLGLILPHKHVPFHLIHPVKFHLYNHAKWTESSFNILKYASQHHKDCWFLGFLCYDVVFAKSPNHMSQDWDEFLQQQFTTQITHNFYNHSFKEHLPMILKCSSADETVVDVYFFRDYRAIDGDAFVELLKHEDIVIPESNGELLPIELHTEYERDGFLLNGANKIIADTWYEKTTWAMQENISQVFKSIARYNSHDFYLKGVLKPADSSCTSKSHGDQQQVDSFAAILRLFNDIGEPLHKSVHHIPVIPDRLLCNVKTEDDVKNLNYEESLQLIGHGLEYCVDSMSSLRLDNRLIKIQKRYVPDDTVNLSKSAPQMAVDKGNVHEKTSGSTSSNQNQSRKSIEASETRSERHKRRLKLLIDGTMVKYGGIATKDSNYRSYCYQLFKICLPIVKKLKSSKGLNDQMKVIARENLHKVIHK